MKKKYRICCLLSFLIFIVISCAQTIPDSVLLEQIAKIKAIDNHSHILPATANQGTEEEPDDLLGKPRFDKPVNVRFDNLHWIGAWRDLYGYKYTDMEKEHLSLVFKEKQRIKREQGENYPTWVLDKLGIETALVNWGKLGLGQTPPRFYWVPYADDFLNPFSSFYSLQNNQIDKKPEATLAEYTKTVVTPAMELCKKEGAIAIKFRAAYQRPLNFEKVSGVEAASVYEQLLQEKEVSISEQRKLEDYLFRYITQEAGRLDLKVHIHTGIGGGTHFNISGSNPMLLESVFNDPDQRNTKFVIIHGGWPFEKEAGAMLQKPNVYADFSAQTFLRSTHALSKTIRAWLEWHPEKVLFGTDAATPNSPLINWEEYAWLSTKTARNALAIALTEMMNDGQISRNRALELAEMVLRTNAIRLYDLKTKLLVEKGAYISLHTAARQGLQEDLKKLIEKGADVNAKDSSGRTPLHYAASEGYKEIIELLLENGADVNIRVKYYNLTAAEIAMNNNHNKVVELLIAKGADISPLHLAIYMKDEAKAKSLIEGGADVNERTPYGTTPMHGAVDAGLKDIVELLIAKGADVNVRTPYGTTPMHRAVEGLKDIVELLIAKGADVNSRDNWSWTPLHSAVYGHNEIVELLIAKGANVNARDEAGRTPLWYAQDEGHTKIVELLRKHGAKE
ncbi:MAG TPA: ankyrin repeat domain-containing protein [Sedimentisphaerales bacterium]|nr:ankyrin repeat domain-containing protein [Sedimentisphaerales bacterium]